VQEGKRREEWVRGGARVKGAKKRCVETWGGEVKEGRKNREEDEGGGKEGVGSGQGEGI